MKLMDAGVVLVWLSLMIGGASQLISAGNKMIVDYDATNQTLRLSSSMDVASVRITFDDTPGQYMTVLELRQWIKARPVPKP